jgi:cyclohexanone monooxygenase
MSDQQSFDAIVVGAGFAGMYQLHRLRKQGLSVKVYEAGRGVGGTWYWNRYPGARCDVQSMEYSYQFCDQLQQEWNWSERYAAQPEILSYANHVADRFDLRPDIQFDTKVASAHFDKSDKCWQITTDTGEAVEAKYFIMATGCLSSTNTPDFKGLQSFRGDTYHTGQWPHEGVDFTGKRVAVIGTGSSAIQSIPIIAEQAAHLYVFQRTANYSVPSRNGRMEEDFRDDYKAHYAERRKLAKANRAGILRAANDVSALSVSEEERNQRFEERWEEGGLTFGGAFNDLMLNKEANATAAEFVRDKIRQTVTNPAVAELLAPRSLIGCKRPCVDTNYYQTFNRNNVTLVDISDAPIDEITPSGLTVGPDVYAVDAIVFATGFDAMTGALLKVDIRGNDGQTLAESWAEGPRTYLGLMTVGFPNMFTITGPGSPSVLTNMLPSIEQHVEWVSDCIGFLEANGNTEIEATLAAQDAWVDRVNAIADATLYPGCNSWYLGANIPGKPRVFMPHIGFPDYVAKCDEVAANNYEGFAVS